MTPREHAARPGGREAEELRARIQALVHQANHADGAGPGSIRAQRREIEQLRAELAACVRRHST